MLAVTWTHAETCYPQCPCLLVGNARQHQKQMPRPPVAGSIELVSDRCVTSDRGERFPAVGALSITTFSQHLLGTLAVFSKYSTSISLSLNSLCFPTPLLSAEPRLCGKAAEVDWAQECHILSLTSCGERWENAMATRREEHPPACCSELPAKRVVSPPAAREPPPQ